MTLKRWATLDEAREENYKVNAFILSRKLRYQSRIRSDCLSIAVVLKNREAVLPISKAKTPRSESHMMIIITKTGSHQPNVM